MVPTLRREASTVRSSAFRNGGPIAMTTSTIMAVRRQEKQFRSGVLDRFLRNRDLLTRQIVGDDGIAGHSRRDHEHLDPDGEHVPIDRSPMTIGAKIRPLRNPAMLGDARMPRFCKVQSNR